MRLSNESWNEDSYRLEIPRGGMLRTRQRRGAGGCLAQTGTLEGGDCEAPEAPVAMK